MRSEMRTSSKCLKLVNMTQVLAMGMLGEEGILISVSACVGAAGRAVVIAAEEKWDVVLREIETSYEAEGSQRFEMPFKLVTALGKILRDGCQELQVKIEAEVNRVKADQSMKAIVSSTTRPDRGQDRAQAMTQATAEVLT